MISAGNYLAVQWLGLHASTAGGPGSIPGGELRPRKPRGVAKKKKKRMISVNSWLLINRKIQKDKEICVYIYMHTHTYYIRTYMTCMGLSICIFPNSVHGGDLEEMTPRRR